MKSPSTVRAVAFDLDGLMFNTEILHHEVGETICNRRGKRFEEKLRRQMMGQPARVSLQILIDYHGLDDTVEGLADETWTTFQPLLAERLALMPGLESLLAALESAGVPKGVATSSGPQFAHHVLGRFDLIPRFEFVLTSEDVVHGKPNPEIYLTAAKRHGVSPGEMLVLEDSGHGLRAAVNAGAVAVAVPGDHSRDHDFTGAAFVADTLADERIYRAIGIPLG